MLIPDTKKHNLFSQLFIDAETRTFKKRSVVFDSASEIDGLYMMLDGQIKVTLQSEDGDPEYTLNTVGLGDPLPLPLYFGMKTPRVKYIAETNVTTAWRPRGEVDEYFAAHPTELHSLIRLIFSVMYGRVNTLARGSAEEKVLQRLIELSERWAVPGEDRFEIKTTQQDLADSVGLSRESVNQMLNKLQDKGVLTNSRNRIFMSVTRATEEMTNLTRCGS